MRRGGCSVAQPGWLPTWPVQRADAAPRAGLSRGLAERMSASRLGRVDLDAPQPNFPYAVLQGQQCPARARCSDGVVLCTEGVGTFGGAECIAKGTSGGSTASPPPLARKPRRLNRTSKSTRSSDVTSPITRFREPRDDRSIVAGVRKSKLSGAGHGPLDGPSRASPTDSSIGNKNNQARVLECGFAAGTQTMETPSAVE